VFSPPPLGGVVVPPPPELAAPPDGAGVGAGVTGGTGFSAGGVGVAFFFFFFLQDDLCFARFLSTPDFFAFFRQEDDVLWRLCFLAFEAPASGCASALAGSPSARIAITNSAMTRVIPCFLALASTARLLACLPSVNPS